MDHKVVFVVLIEGKLEFHVGEGSVRVEPPDPLGFRVSNHGGSDQGYFRPTKRHLWVKQCVVVEDIVPVDSAVINFVFEEPEAEAG